MTPAISYIGAGDPLVSLAKARMTASDIIFTEKVAAALKQGALDRVASLYAICHPEIRFQGRGEHSLRDRVSFTITNLSTAATALKTAHSLSPVKNESLSRLELGRTELTHFLALIDHFDLKDAADTALRDALSAEKESATAYLNMCQIIHASNIGSFGSAFNTRKKFLSARDLLELFKPMDPIVVKFEQTLAAAEEALIWHMDTIRGLPPTAPERVYLNWFDPADPILGMVGGTLERVRGYLTWYIENANNATGFQEVKYARQDLLRGRAFLSYFKSTDPIIERFKQALASAEERLDEPLTVIEIPLRVRVETGAAADAKAGQEEE